MDHFETRATFAEYSLWALEGSARLLEERFDIETLSNLLGNLPRPSGDSRLPFPLRIAILEAELNVFVEIFEPLLGSALQIQAEESSHPKLAAVCFMWWELTTFEEPELSGAFRKICERLLQSPSAAVQEAALHGLGDHIGGLEAVFGGKDLEAVTLIDHFIGSKAAQRNELYEYAKAAKTGNIL